MSSKSNREIYSACLASVIKDPDLEMELSDAMANVTIVSTMMSYTMYQCEYRFCDTPDMPTAMAVVTSDGNFVFFDVNFWKIQGIASRRAYLLYHELQHLFLEHPTRGVIMGYDQEAWGLAVDFYVNYVCNGAYKKKDSRTIQFEKKPQKFLSPCVGIPPLYDEMFVGMCSDEIYEYIMANSPKFKKMAPSDVHIDPIDLEEGGDGGMKLKAQIIKNRQTLTAAAALAQSNDGIGSHEAGIVEHITTLVKPIVEWPSLVKTHVSGKLPIRETYNRLSRKTSGRVVFPTYVGNHIDMVVGVDSSGSMGETDFIRCFSEIIGILSELDSFTLRLVSCDTMVHEMGRYDSDSYFDASDMKFSPKGRGGTNMTPIVEYADALCEDGENVDMLIIMTDGQISDCDLSNTDYDADYDKIILVTRRIRVERDGFTTIYAPA